MNTKFRPLPLDYQRCYPHPIVADKCKTCRRWGEHPEQTWGARTPFGSDHPGRCDEPEPESHHAPQPD